LRSSPGEQGRLSRNVDDEQLELAAKLIDINRTVEDDQDGETVEGLDIFSLQHMPPENSFVAQMRFVDASEGESARFDFGRAFDDDLQ
jgi:hypothetical protein